MEICSGGSRKLAHEDIVYDGNFCPLCEAKKEIDDLEDKIDTLENELEEERAN